MPHVYEVLYSASTEISLCHITDIITDFNDRKMSWNFHGFTELLQIHGSVMKSQNFPGFPDDHGIITDSQNFHRFRKFGNIRGIVYKTRKNLCIVKLNHGNITELSLKIQGTCRGS